MERDEIKPIVLLADSQLLFWSDAGGARFLERVRACVVGDDPRAAYLGAANGDQPEFYDLFRAAMSDVGLTRCRHVPAEPSTNDLAFLESADLVLLAGGDPVRGQEPFQRHGIGRVLLERYYTGAVLVGVSAGAVQLGLRWRAGGNGSGEVHSLLGLVPFIVGAHEEPDWKNLRGVVQAAGTAFRGLGVPTGGGVLVHPDRSIEPVRHALTLLEWDAAEALRPTLVAPGAREEAETEPAGGGRR